MRKIESQARNMSLWGKPFGLLVIHKAAALILALMLAFGTPALAFAQSTTTSYYLSQAGEGISTITNGFSNIANGFSSAGENLSLAGIALARDIRDSVVSTAESIREETVNLAVETKDAIVAGALALKQGAVSLATATQNTAVAFKNDYVAHAVATADAVTGGAHAIIRGLTHTGDSILAYFAAMSTLAAATPAQANQQTSWLGPQPHD